MSSAPVVPGIGIAPPPAASGTAVHDITEILASTTIDTTAAQVVGVAATWSVASASNSCRLDFLRVEIH